MNNMPMETIEMVRVCEPAKYPLCNTPYPPSDNI